MSTSAEPTPAALPVVADARREAVQARVGLVAALVLLVACLALLVVGGRPANASVAPSTDSASSPAVDAGAVARGVAVAD